jgi:RimJ/RimL family protein N-acetyltransferase
MSVSTTSPEREQIRALLDEHSPADALATYYALHHDRARSAVFLHFDPAQPALPDGFLVRAQTGQDLFRPLVTLRAPSSEAALDLFQRGLQGGRPNYLTVPAGQAGYVNQHLAVNDAAIFRVFRLAREHFKPVVNIFVTVERGPDNQPRYEIRNGDRVLASAGSNWRSPNYAELYVYVDSGVRGRGYGKSVVARAAADLLEAGITPLYVVAEDNLASIRTAQAVGFSDTGAREYICEAVLLGAQ